MWKIRFAAGSSLSLPPIPKGGFICQVSAVLQSHSVYQASVHNIGYLIADPSVGTAKIVRPFIVRLEFSLPSVRRLR